MDNDIIEQIRRAQEIVEGSQDNLCRALMAIASYGSITIIPRDENLVNRPVIIVPKQMYDRMLKLGEGSND